LAKDAVAVCREIARAGTATMRMVASQATCVSTRQSPEFEGATVMDASRPSRHWPLMDLGKVLKTALLGLAGAVIFGIAVTIGYQTEQQASR